MTRRPRKPEEHLVSGKLLGHAYGNMGELATCGGFFTYNLIMNVYGFPFFIYFELLSRPTFNPCQNSPPGYCQLPGVNENYNKMVTYSNGGNFPNPNLNVTNGFNPTDPNLGSIGYYNYTLNTSTFDNTTNTTSFDITFPLLNCQEALSTGLLQSGNNYPNWLAIVNNVVDLRYAYVECCQNNITTGTVNTSYCTPFGSTFGETPVWPDPTVNG